MTRERLVDEMFEVIDGVSRETLRKAADRIIGLIAKEKDEEAVLGEFTGGVDVDILLRQAHSSRKPIKIATLCAAGKIIFRQQEKKP